MRVAANAELQRQLPAAIELRHRLHRQPYVGGAEHPTRELLRAALDGLVLTDVVEGGLVRIGGDGRAVAIRAELDALPIAEASGVEFASERPGCAHLCGHDVHMAALVATVRTLQAVFATDSAAAAVAAPLLAVFQPREEVVPPGAVDFIDRPELDRASVIGMVGVHVQPVLPAGAFSAEAGPINASADTFEIVVRGRPAHGAYPHLGRDPIVAAAAVIQALQHLVSRRTDPIQPAVVTVGKIAGGDAHNQVPGEVTMLGTVRAYDESHRAVLHAELRTAAQATAAAYGCTADVDVHIGEPLLDNDPALSARVTAALRSIGLTAAPPWRSCGADDFAYYGTRVPALMVFAGVGDATPGTPGLHHPAFVPDDRAVGDVARIMLASYFSLATADPVTADLVVAPVADARPTADSPIADLGGSR